MRSSIASLLATVLLAALLASDANAGRVYCTPPMDALEPESIVIEATVRSGKGVQRSDGYEYQVTAERASVLAGKPPQPLPRRLRLVYGVPRLWTSIGGEPVRISVSRACSGDEMHLEPGKRYVFYVDDATGPVISYFAVEQPENVAELRAVLRDRAR